MRSVNLRGALLAMAALSHAACYDFSGTMDPGASSSAAPPVKWYVFATRLGRYHVDLPGEPERQQTTTAERPTYIATVKRPDSIYIFSELEAGQGPAMSLTEYASRAPEVMAKSFVGLPVACSHSDSRDVTLSGLRGVEFDVHCGPTASSRVRLFDAGDRAFQLVVSGTPETVASQTAERFLGSLRLRADPVAH